MVKYLVYGDFAECECVFDCKQRLLFSACVGKYCSVYHSGPWLQPVCNSGRSVRDGGPESGGHRICADVWLYCRMFCQPSGVDFCRFVPGTGLPVCDEETVQKNGRDGDGSGFLIKWKILSKKLRKINKVFTGERLIFFRNPSYDREECDTIEKRVYGQGELAWKIIRITKREEQTEKGRENICRSAWA